MGLVGAKIRGYQLCVLFQYCVISFLCFMAFFVYAMFICILFKFSSRVIFLVVQSVVSSVCLSVSVPLFWSHSSFTVFIRYVRLNSSKSVCDNRTLWMPNRDQEFVIYTSLTIYQRLKTQTQLCNFVTTRKREPPNFQHQRHRITLLQ